MTEKQEKILRAALHLFATQGYSTTSTSKVAKEAGVSEGLIFRHFENKAGLLQAILDQGKEATQQIFTEVIMTKDPKERIRKMLEIPFRIPLEQYKMWRLIYALKWQTNRYEEDYQHAVRLVLKDAFEALDYANPTAEVELVFILIDGAATSFLLHEPKEKNALLQALMSKYNL